jgi:hypothetical protein
MDHKLSRILYFPCASIGALGKIAQAHEFDSVARTRGRSSVWFRAGGDDSRLWSAKVRVAGISGLGRCSSSKDDPNDRMSC